MQTPYGAFGDQLMRAGPADSEEDLEAPAWKMLSTKWKCKLPSSLCSTIPFVQKLCMRTDCKCVEQCLEEFIPPSRGVYLQRLDLVGTGRGKGSFTSFVYTFCIL